MYVLQIFLSARSVLDARIIVRQEKDSLDTMPRSILLREFRRTKSFQGLKVICSKQCAREPVSSLP